MLPLAVFQDQSDWEDTPPTGAITILGASFKVDDAPAGMYGLFQAMVGMAALLGIIRHHFSHDVHPSSGSSVSRSTETHTPHLSLRELSPHHTAGTASR